MSSSDDSHIYQLKITLDDIQPSIWRRIQVPGDVSLFKLHFILQIAMGWTNSHLHEFLIGSQYYGDPEDDELGTRRTKREKHYWLEQVIPGEGFQFSYLYDFGDGWQHTIVVEDILEREEGRQYPTLLDGERACPPEDVGSSGGYEHMLEAVRDPQHEEHEDYLAWTGGGFDPEAFDRQRVDEELKNVDRSEMVRVYLRYYGTEVGPELKLYTSISEWIEHLTKEERSQLEELPLRRDTVTLLTYLRDNRVTGTQSTGNLPLKAIREVTANFVNPPVLEEKVGDRIFKMRSEDDVWPVYFVDVLARVGGLLEGGPGRRLRLTTKGEQFLEAEPALQVLFLLETWWYHTNWLIAVPFGAIGEGLPYAFELTTLDYLLELPVESPIEYERFADRLIFLTNLKWTAQDMTYARKLLHDSIENMVISILEDFGAVETVYKDKWIGSYKSEELDTFSLTRLGWGLLRAVAGARF